MNGTTIAFQIDQSEPCAGMFVGMGSFSLVRYPPVQPLALRDDAHVLVGGFAF